MDIIRFTINNPVKVTVGVLLVCLFGVLALFQIPIQLTPNVDEPQITVTTRWEGKSAREVERELVDRQEEMLKGVENLKKMTSQAHEGRAEVTLDFYVGTDKDAALRDVDQKLNQVTNYPPEAEKPEVVASESALSSPIAWLIFSAEDGSDVSTYRDFMWDNVKPILERVPGLSNVNVYGGREREVHVEIDPAMLAARGLTLRDVEAALRGENVNVSAGTITQGKREQIYRTVGQYEEVDQVEGTVIAYRDGGPILVRDVGRVVKTYERQTSMVRSKGRPVLGMPVYRETGANVIEVMEGLKQQIAKVNKEILNPRGLGLELTQVYDETVYIDASIALVRNNILFGGALAAIVLLVFLRNIRATSVVAVSIPISVIGTFLAVAALGRNINVVMLAGMAFAVGMVVDNAVVVLENIYRHLQMNKPPFRAALEGGAEVWGAVLASTLTTVAVFVPVIFIEEEAGQLFRDISIAISAGVVISLLVSVLVIPTLSARVLSRKGTVVTAEPDKQGGFSTAVSDLVIWINKSILLRLAVIVVFVFGSLAGSWLLKPPTDYLPTGNRNLVLGFVFTEPGLSIPEFTDIAYDVEAYLRPYWEAEPGSPEADALPELKIPKADTGPMRGPNAEMISVPPPLLENFFFVARGNSCFMGSTSKDPNYVKPMVELLTNAATSSPRTIGSFPLFFQTALFGGVRSSNSIDVEVRSDNLDLVNKTAGMLFGALMQSGLGYPESQPNNFDLPRPETRAVPSRVRAADVGLNVRDIGQIVEASVDGTFVGTFRDQGDEVDMRVRFMEPGGTPVASVWDVPVYAPVGVTIPLRSVVDFQETGAPQQINHIEEMPGVALRVRAPQGQALEAVMDKIENEVIAPLREAGQIDPSVIIALAGTADKLVQTRAAMFGKWGGSLGETILAVLQSRGFLALLIVYLLMAALFESFLHPIAIMLTVPLAMVGGFAGLRVVNYISLQNPVTPVQQLDVVTMLGFVILLGIVVNNAILIVHQTLNNLREGRSQIDALHESVRTRIRPIFMTAFTSIGGMIPLALMGGAGSELYRGLAGVMVGGLLVSTIFTIILVPTVFSMFLGLRTWLLKAAGREDVLERETGSATTAPLAASTSPTSQDISTPPSYAQPEPALTTAGSAPRGTDESER